MGDTIGTHDWDTFEQGLALGIARACVEDAVIFAWHNLGFVQFHQGDDYLHVEVSDNGDLPLTARQRETLAAAGWNGPGSGFGPMWTQDLHWRPHRDFFDAAARLITGVLRDVIAIKSPADLDVKAFNVLEHDDFVLPILGDEHQRGTADVALRLADIPMHEAVATFLIAQDYPAARTVAVPARAADHRPSADYAGEYFLDRVLYVDGDDPHILVWSHVGPTGRTGSRLVPPHPDPSGRWVRASQGSAHYVRDLLQRNKTIGAALAADPDLHERMTALLRSGRPDVVRAYRVTVDAEAAVTVGRHRLAPEVLDVPTLQLARSSDLREL
ncbi:TY-Chap domain-containing protein [Actinoplanes philippinensis]|uniref:TY-Chap domain-containing protein n=1 Tax=Actinoplanes philippinensis TaxID=35752 RepID=UPI0033CCD682